MTLSWLECRKSAWAPCRRYVIEWRARKDSNLCPPQIRSDIDKTHGACEVVAKRVIELMNGERDPEVIRQAILASIKAKAG